MSSLSGPLNNPQGPSSASKDGSKIIGHEFNPEVFAQSMHWRVIWIKVIAKAWADKDFKKDLKDNPHETILKHFRYELNSELDLYIKEVDELKNGLCVPMYMPNVEYPPYNKDAPYNKDVNKNIDSTVPFKDPWAGLPRHKLVLVLPPKPQDGDNAIALGDYADTGRTYPMTSG